MIKRYTRPEMAKIWSDENRYNCWLEVEILADEAWAELGEIPKEDVEKIRKNTFNCEFRIFTNLFYVFFRDFS